MNSYDIDALYKKLQQYPFFRTWQKGKLSEKLFRQNMEAFKDDFKNEGISEDELKWVLEEEVSKR